MGQDRPKDRRWPVTVYDEKRVALISGAVAEAIDAAAFGIVSWDEIPRVMGKHSPDRCAPSSITMLLITH